MARIFRALFALLLLPLLLSAAPGTVRAEAEDPVDYEAPYVARLSYTEFLQAVRAGTVDAVTVNGRRISGYFQNGEQFYLTGPESDPALTALLDQHGVKTYYEAPAAFSGTSTVLSVAVVALFFLFLIMRRQPGQAGAQATAGGPGKSGAQIIKPGESNVTFESVAGMDEVKADLQELVDFLKRPDRYTAMGARIPRGVLLSGGPGTGKTLLARAVAGEAGVSFIHFSASQFVEVYVGVGASRVRDLFAQARKHKPCIIFMDEIDAVGRHRGGSAGGNDEREQTLNQLLVEMDGFESGDGIVVMAATNRPDVLDKALLRPGRFDRQVTVDTPDLTGRRAILAVHSAGKTFDKTVSMEVIARQTPGFTGADLANLLNESALQAVRSGKTAISMVEVEEAMDRVLAGGPAKQNRLITAAEKRRIAVHEAGHALAARLSSEPDPVQKVTIIPRGKAGGFTLTMPDEDKFLHTRSELFRRLVMLMAGRAAEEIMLGEASTGAHDDLNRAFGLARQMVAVFGMNDDVGPIGIPTDHSGQAISQELAAQIDRETRRVLSQAAEKARTLLESNRAKLLAVTEALVERETIGGRELDRLLGIPAGLPQLVHDAI